MHTFDTGLDALLGFRFDPPPLASAREPNRTRALFRARKVLEGIVYDTVALEGNPYTFPEVKTLIDGITVGGRRISDTEQVLNTADAWREMFRQVDAGTFTPDVETALTLHDILARREALEWGQFRNGAVQVAGTDMAVPPAEGLAEGCEAGLERLSVTDTGAVGCVHARAIATFLFFARNQFFWDGNKRLGRLMMNGILLDAGCEAINVPAARQAEFNAAMVAFYDSLDADAAIPFIVSCSHDETLEAVKPGLAGADAVSDPPGPGV